MISQHSVEQTIHGAQARYALQQLWADSESAIAKKHSPPMM